MQPPILKQVMNIYRLLFKARGSLARLPLPHATRRQAAAPNLPNTPPRGRVLGKKNTRYVFRRSIKSEKGQVLVCVPRRRHKFDKILYSSTNFSVIIALFCAQRSREAATIRSGKRADFVAKNHMPASPCLADFIRFTACLEAKKQTR